MSDLVYCYPPEGIVLRNKLDIRDTAALDKIERRLVRERADEGTPSAIST